jgi:putative endonuclease
MKKSSFAYGVASEKLVADHLQSQGYEIIGSRYKTTLGEIDLIARKTKVVVFVEVKARTSPRDEYVSRSQIRRCLPAAEQFLQKTPLYEDFETRFDLAVIINCKIHQYIERAWTGFELY